MKIRILENSLRLRLKQSEVKQLAEEGSVNQVIEFGVQTALHYTLEKSASETIKASFSDSRIVVEVPHILAENWAQSNEVSLSETMSIGENKILKVLIEKDFKCLTIRPGEDESDMFPNPKESH